MFWLLLNRKEEIIALLLFVKRLLLLPLLVPGIRFINSERQEKTFINNLNIAWVVKMIKRQKSVLIPSGFIFSLVRSLAEHETVKQSTSKKNHRRGFMGGLGWEKKKFKKFNYRSWLSSRPSSTLNEDPIKIFLSLIAD